jgi:protein-tyrosine-phosphatase
VTSLPSSVLFVCNLNAVRSPMAEGLMRRRFGQRVWARSCGVRQSAEVDPFAAEAMEELGVDISGHRPHSLDSLEDGGFDLVITLTPEAHHMVLDRARTVAVDVEYWPTHDPTDTDGSREQKLDAYRSVRDWLDARIAARFTAPST